MSTGEQSTVNSVDEDPLFVLVKRHCTLDVIQGLLRDAKAIDPKEVRVSAENKHDAVFRNLRDAVDKRLVPTASVHKLIQDGEENGGQHIFFYKSRNQSVARALKKWASVAAQLFPAGLDRQKFPRLLAAPPTKTSWADFRGDDEGWVAKLYGRATKSEPVGGEEADSVDPTDGETIYRKRYKRSHERTVLLARYRAKIDLLEVRVPTWSSRRTIEDMEKIVWDSLSAAVQRNDVVPWSLSRACTRMLNEETKHSAVYSLGDTTLRDSGRGTHLVSPSDESQSLYAVIERRNAIAEVLKKDGNQAEQLIVWFKPVKATDAIDSDLRVVVGAHDLHEIIIGSKTSPSALDYVVHRLRDFAS